MRQGPRSAADVAKDAADVVLLDKDLGIIANGVVEGRRIFANTIKYVLMGTSSNFGNMFSAAGASLFLSFLPMLPTQILLNNLLYDVSEMTIPTDNVDEELLPVGHQPDPPLHGVLRPDLELYDFLTFAVMLRVFDAGPTLFRSGWFVESLATQTLVIFVIRTRRVPFFKSRPSRPLLTATLSCAALGVAIPYIEPLARPVRLRAVAALLPRCPRRHDRQAVHLDRVLEWELFDDRRATRLPGARRRTGGRRGSSCTYVRGNKRGLVPGQCPARPVDTSPRAARACYGEREHRDDERDGAIHPPPPPLPLLQVKAATVSSRKTAASAQAKNRIARLDTSVCRHNPTRARTTNTAATSSTTTRAATTRVPVERHFVADADR